MITATAGSLFFLRKILESCKNHATRLIGIAANLPGEVFASPCGT
jgi:hypothetical protein